jgi:hypothetical protein
MWDLVYDFIFNNLLNATNPSNHVYYDELGNLLTHITMWLFYLVLVLLIVHLFNAFRSMTRFW